jgi:hypothetical protein
MKGWASLVEARIVEAQAKGMLDRLPGAGKPLPDDPAMSLPAAERQEVILQRSLGAAPEEVSLLREIAELRERLAARPGDQEVARDLAKKRDRLRFLFEASGRHHLARDV